MKKQFHRRATTDDYPESRDWKFEIRLSSIDEMDGTSDSQRYCKAKRYVENACLTIYETLSNPHVSTKKLTLV